MSRHEWPDGTEALLDDIMVDAYGDDEQLCSLHQAFEDAVPLPAYARVIGELSLGDDFDGLLPWERVDNRPFLGCMHGFGLCLWRLDRPQDAETVFERMLWLNPADYQGILVLLSALQAGDRWDDHWEGEDLDI
jgi:hypothetical protein